jgi:hypothetical protein
MSIRLFSLFMGISFLLIPQLVFSAPLKTETEAAIKKLIDGYKEDVYINGSSTAKAVEKFIGRMIQNPKVDQQGLREYMIKHLPDANIFLSQIDSKVKGQENLEQEQVKELMAQLLQNTSRTGAHFMSCGASLGVGIPLLASAVVFTVIAVSNHNMNEIRAKKIYERRLARWQRDYDYNMAELQEQVDRYAGFPNSSNYINAVNNLNQYYSHMGNRYNELQGLFGKDDTDSSNDFKDYVEYQKSLVPLHTTIAGIAGALSVYPLINAGLEC